MPPDEMSGARYYSLVPGVDVVELGRDSVLLRSDTLSVRVDGAAARFIASLATRLRGSAASADELARGAEGPDAAAVGELLDRLVASRVVRVATAQAGSEATDSTLGTFLAQLGRDPTDARALAAASVGVAGVSAHGAHVASQLAAIGVGRIKLLDGSALLAGHEMLVPPSLRTNGERAAAEVKRVLDTAPGATRTRVEVADDAGRDAIGPFLEGLDLVISCVDRGAAATDVWLNEASLASRTPVIYTRVAAHRALVGPLVAPPGGPCYLCSRMRAIACAPDFDAAMKYEEWLDRHEAAEFDRRPVLPGVLLYVAGLVVTDAVKLLLGIAPPSLASAIFEFDALTFATTRHQLLAVPDCPACGSPTEPLPGPGVDGLAASQDARGDLLGAEDSLVGAHCGVVRDLTAVHKDIREPEIPFLYSARLANRAYLTADQDRWVCSGKGATREDARLGALGEAIERYGAFSWPAAPLRRAAARELDGRVLHPRDLVLFDASQYPTLPYAPASDLTELAWVRGRDLVSGDEVLVPAIAVLMDYVPRSAAERIAPTTSNGLGGGATLADAVLAGLHEVLERDAFMIAWLQRLPVRQIDPLTHPDGAIRDVCRAYARRGIDIEVYRLPTDHPAAAFLALAVARDAREIPAVVVGLGADVDPAAAARKAILEVGQMRPTMRAQARDRDARERMERLVADPSSVSTMDDHGLLYASPAMRGAFDRFRDAAVVPQDWASRAQDPIAKLRTLVEWSASQGIAVVYCDLTPADVRALRLFSARVIVSGFQPIHFGERERRLGGDRLFELPRALGFADSRRSLSALDPLPHPLA